jgi:hypothetical protein
MDVPAVFHGGRVIRNPHLYLIFWGSNWTHEEEAERWRGHIRNTLGGLTEEYGFNLTYQHILNQYYDSTGPIEGVTLAGEYVYEAIGAPQGQEREDIKAEVELAIAQKGWPREPNSIFIVLHPPGTAYQEGFTTEAGTGCGFHERDHQGDVFAFIPDLANHFFSAKCGGYAEEEREGQKIILYNRIVTFLAAHEYVEATTDPEQGGGWYDSEGYELGDICEEHGPIKVNEALGIWMAGVWGNHEAAEKGENEGCVVKDPPEPPPPPPSAVTEGATSASATEATVTGAVKPNGPDAHYYFEYGTTTAYGQSSPPPPGSDAGFGENAVPVTKTLSGLRRGTIYHYRLVASSWAGTTRGLDMTFTTPSWSIQTTVNPPGEKQRTEMTGVSCWSTTGCAAAGYFIDASGVPSTLIERWDGSTWSQQETPNPPGDLQKILNSISCSSATACVATGFYDVSDSERRALALRWNGTTWKLIPPVDPTTYDELRKVSCTSGSACTAVGDSSSGPLAERWNGKTWTVQEVPIPEGGGADTLLLDVSCATAKACMAVGRSAGSISGTDRTLAESWNGVAWTVQTTIAPLEDSGFGGVSCSAATACTAVGSDDNIGQAGQALIERWNGAAWEVQPSPAPPGGEQQEWGLSEVSCPGLRSCVAVGAYGKRPGHVGLLLGERWNGTEWESRNPSEPSGVEYAILTGVSCSAATVCTTVGYTHGLGGYELEPFFTLAEQLMLPGAEANPASELTTTSATLNGTVNPEGQETTYHFEYGTTSSYGTDIPVPDATAGASTSEIAVSQRIAGLQSKTTYHFRLVSTSAGGTTNSGDRTFKTK